MRLWHTFPVRVVFLPVSRPVGMAWIVGEAGGGMAAFALVTGTSKFYSCVK